MLPCRNVKSRSVVCRGQDKNYKIIKVVEEDVLPNSRLFSRAIN